MVAPKVSIVLPTYNAAPFLRASIGSALRQTLTDFELLVMDNASTDNTRQVVSTFSDRRIRYVRNAENHGFGGNIARGFTLARGEYVTLLGADDLFEPTFLENTAAMLDRHPLASMVHTDAIWIDEDGRAFGESAASWPKLSGPREAFINCFRHGFCTSALMMRRIHLDGPDWQVQESWGPGADLPLFLWLCLSGEVGYINSPLAYYRHHRRNMSTAMFGGAGGGLLWLEKWGLDLALGWPCARHVGIESAVPEIRTCIASRNIRMLHLGRIEGLWWSWLKTFGEAIALSPRVLFMPATWARFVFGLLPRRAIRHLQQLRHSRARARYAAMSVAHAAPAD